MSEKLRPEVLMLLCREVAPVTTDLDVEGAGTKKLNLRDL